MKTDEFEINEWNNEQVHTGEGTAGHKHSHDHGHHHSPQVRKKQLNRLAKIIGHLQYVRRMIENDEDCADVLMQLAASKSAINGLGKEIINEHLAHCICHAIEDGDMEAVEEFQKAIQKYI